MNQTKQLPIRRSILERRIPTWTNAEDVINGFALRKPEINHNPETCGICKRRREDQQHGR